MSKEDPIWVTCSTCNHKTEHQLVAQVDDPIYDEDGQCGEITYGIVRCMGSKTLSFIRRTFDRNDAHPDGEGGWDLNITQEEFPKILAGLPMLKEDYWLPPAIKSLYRETHQAMCSSSRVLAGIGMRTIVEAICKQEVTMPEDAAGKRVDLKRRIEAMVTEGKMTKDGASILTSLRFMGNKAAHEIQPHTMEDLSTGFEVVESVLKSLYIIPHKARMLERKMDSKNGMEAPDSFS